MARRASTSRRVKGAGSLGLKSNGVYRPYVTINGKREYLGSFQTEEDARKALQRRELLRPTESAAPTHEKARTFEFVLLDAIKRPKPGANSSTAKFYDMQWHLDRGYLNSIRGIPIRNITVDDITDLYDELANMVSEHTKKPLGKATIRSVRATINTVFAHAIYRRWHTDNPATFATYRMQAPKKNLLPENEDENIRAKKFTADEESAILAAFEYNRYRARWMLAYRYALRPAEALGLTDDDWDSAAQVLRIRKALVVKKQASVDVTKQVSPLTVADLKTAGSHRRIRVDSETAKLIDDWIVQRDAEIGDLPRMLVAVEGDQKRHRYKFLFTQRPRVGEVPPLTPGTDEDEFARICRDAGVDATRYTLRHHALSRLVEHFPLPVVARLAGHKDITMLIEHYVHAASDEVAEIATLFEPKP